ncbi:MAG: hypothetical protein ACON39_03805 [Coraliomargaritaceae bacterium]
MPLFSDTFSRRQVFAISGISLFFLAAYFVLRALPSAQCGFLHYEEVVNAEGEVEFCATNHAGFLDLSVLTYPVRMELNTEEIPEVGVEQAVTLQLETSGGMPIAPHELAITHTEKMHVMLVDPSLRDYHHVHPEADGLNGLYRFQFTPENAGSYKVYTEVVPLRSRRQVIATGLLPVSGSAQSPEFSNTQIATIDGLHFALSGVPERLLTGRDYRFSLDVDDAEGEPAVLETIMGARGHMVAFDAERRGFAHMHPIASVLGEESDSEAALSFLFNVPNPGWYRLFAQVQVDGREVFGRFDLLVE